MNNTTTHQTKETTVFRLIKRGQEQGRRRRFLPCIPSLPRSFRFRRIDLGIFFFGTKILIFVLYSVRISVAIARISDMPACRNKIIKRYQRPKKKRITRFAPAKNKEIARGPCTTLDMCTTYLPITYYVCVCVCVRRTTRESY
jgi:hypothetical protein